MVLGVRRLIPLVDLARTDGRAWVESIAKSGLISKMQERLGIDSHQITDGAKDYALQAFGYVTATAYVALFVFVGFILALVSLIAQHNIFGWYLPHEMPLWVGIVGLVVLYSLVSGALRAVRHGGHSSAGHHPGWGALHGLLWIGFTVLLFWVAYTFFPGVREVIDQLMWAANLTIENFSETIV